MLLGTVFGIEIVIHNITSELNRTECPAAKKNRFERRGQRGTAARARAATDLETRARVLRTHCFDRNSLAFR